ncbi:NADP-dependent oxidoreductase [Nakamurella sp. YIM 132087]|uniref:NADP-dependent oxidoreductase n=1 Tax=Nakamurella alba TaxID=2665158 RepID=A0A7K1FEB1_9ACTN|nr:NADP-dependent oxidoreductase [Nakamurella alba]MTD12410.1 NADP-dependent oxidoreductase [Nakamurella alba]
MLAVTTTATPGGELHVTQTADPVPAPGEVLVRFEASSVNPADRKIHSGLIRPRIGEGPWVLGWDLVGRVVDGDGFAVGQRVAGMSAMASTGRGTWAELVALPARSLTPVPDAPPAAFAHLPLIGLTARQAVLDLAGRPGERVAVTGAGGGVGSLVVQMLLIRGISPLAVVRDPASPPGIVSQLGLGVAGIEALQPGSVDAVVDAAGVDVGAAVRNHGRYISVVPGAPRTGLAEEVFTTTVRVAEDGGHLAEVVDLVATGSLSLPPAVDVPLREAGRALRSSTPGTRTTLSLAADR